MLLPRHIKHTVLVACYRSEVLWDQDTLCGIHNALHSACSNFTSDTFKTHQSAPSCLCNHPFQFLDCTSKSPSLTPNRMTDRQTHIHTHLYVDVYACTHTHTHTHKHRDLQVKTAGKKGKQAKASHLQLTSPSGHHSPLTPCLSD